MGGVVSAGGGEGEGGGEYPGPLPLHPVSTGRNWGYGGAAPPGGHCVLLDLSGLARILDIDATLGTATIEPG